MVNRTSGVLLHVTSLPGAFGVGGFSQDAKYFISMIADMGFSWWQILPLTTIGQGNSPYSGSSAFAIDYIFADPTDLKERGLISDDEVYDCQYKYEPYTVDYGFVKYHKRAMLNEAFANLTDLDRENVRDFAQKHAYWLKDYALFMAIKETCGDAPWWEWEDGLKKHDEDALKKFEQNHREKVEYYYFEQYILDAQWQYIKSFANSMNVGIIGDIPIYVSLDSADVWGHTSEFQLDKNYKPTKVAGVPPDYFASEGQLWGNPLYNWKKMKLNGYEWWIMRIKRAASLYDSVRIDHFRGLYKYWTVELGSPNAINGKWENGPKMNLIKKIREAVGDFPIIAEDLGQIDDDVRVFLAKTGYPGMRVMQFAFSDTDSLHLPHNYPINCVGYTATHDNNTTLGWLYELGDVERDYALKYCGHDGYAWGAGGIDCTSTKAFIKTLISSSCHLAIVPMQDLCGYGSSTRMNVPGVADNNWIYRATYSAYSAIDRDFILGLNTLYGRRHNYK